jgi:pimeloyl-ACP methyl ester carboxylesterase
VYELHALLAGAGERPPYVLVGHSYGGWLVRVFQLQYPAEVVGMVLLDAGADDPWRMVSDGRLVRSSELATARPIPEVRTAGPLRIADIPSAALEQMRAGLPGASARANEPPRDKLPLEAQQMRTWALGQVGHVAAAVNPFEHEELAALRSHRARTPYPFGAMPLIVMTRGRSDDSGPDGREFEQERRREHAALAALSRNGRHVIAENSGHHIQIDEPDLVVRLILEVVTAARR